MANLLEIGERIEPFTLPLAGTNETLLSSEIIGNRRTVVLVVGDEGASAAKWLSEAGQRMSELTERDMTVLVISPGPESEARFATLPTPVFYLLRDAYHEEEKRLGGAPAFYLVGKDGTIKRADLTFPPLDTIFQQIDSMPMRQQEMKQDP
ncbi:MAG: DUF4174 domain-containing protein [Armatimonadota bacterium]